MKTTYDEKNIKEALSQSPKGISPTDNRINYLMKAKALREKRNSERRETFTNRNGNGYLTPFARRNLAIDQEGDISIPSTLTIHRPSIGPIEVPLDLMPKDIKKHKNASIFTNSLLAGDAVGYAHLDGGPGTTRNKNL